MMPGPHHIELISMHLRVITMPEREASRIDDLIREHFDTMERARGVTAGGVPSPDPGPDAAVLTAAQRLAEIPGVSLEPTIWIIAETGLDMSRFPTAGHLVSWAGLAPVSQQSGKQGKKAKKGKGDAYLKGYCTQASLAASGTDTFPGERHRRLSRRIGGAKAQAAVARSILVIIWHLLSDPAARYTDLGPGWHLRKTDRARRTRSHAQQLRAPGYDVTLTPADPATAA